MPEVRALFFGDTHFARGYEYYNRKEPDYQNRLLNSIKSLSGGLTDYDIISINFEAAPVSLQDCPKTSKSIVLATDLWHLSFFREMGVNMIQAANNHFYDCWENRAYAGYETFEQYDMNVAWMSRRGDLRIIKKNIDGLKLAFVSLNDVDMKIDREKTKQALGHLQDEGYLITVNIHWGEEYKKWKHNSRQEELAIFLVDQWADLIVGHHPHVVQDVDEYKWVKIYYSLGNFLFDQPFPETLEGYALSVTYTQSGIVSDVRIFYRDKKLYIPSWQ